MSVKIGVIADDFTGATDIAGFMSEQGWRVALLPGLPDADRPWTDDADAVVISLKSRSLPAQQATEQALACHRWLKRQTGARQIYVKYCSTFDSTPRGNIGPVCDALMAVSGAPFIAHCPALPQNGRTVVHGHLFVNGVLLNQSGMENHPLNPMKDARIAALLAPQTARRIGGIDLATVQRGEEAVAQALRARGDAQHIIMDTLTPADLLIIAAALRDAPLLAGGSGLGSALAALTPSSCTARHAFAFPAQKRAVVLSGSCSSMTNRQVNAYKVRAPWQALTIARCVNDDEDYADTLAEWVMEQGAAGLAPLVYATQPPQELARIQQQYGEQAASEAVERMFARLAARLLARGVNTFIVAGGETSGTVVEALRVKRLIVGKPIVPGVPWVRETERDLALALKSGNFGDEDFFFRAQEYPL